jgi:hypothetical protein
LMADGSVSTGTSSSTLGIHYVGESYGGGKVFYVYDGGRHGLIAAITDQSNGIRFHGGYNAITRARADGINAGLKNTTIIIGSQGSYDGLPFASTLCNEYVITETKNGITTTYGDWYLPSKYELNLLYLQKDLIGGFSNNYWSSTEYFDSLHPTYGTTWYQNFNDGTQLYNSPSLVYIECKVRAIRSF